MSEREVTLQEIEAEPKIDLHLHLDGALSPETIWNVAQRNQIVIPDLEDQSLAALQKVYPDPGPFHAENPDEFNRFLKLFGRAFSVMLTPKTIYESTLEVIRDLKRQNVIYAELRFAPSYHTTQGFSMNEMTEAVLKAMKDGEKETGVITRLITIIPREIAYTDGYKGPTAEQIVDTALEHQDDGVVGIDLACSEHFGPERYIGAYRKTFGSRLKRTVHAGEAGPHPRQNILTAIREMRADGLGHALPLPSMTQVMATVRQDRIRVERNPISNRCMQVGNGDFDDLQSLLDAEILVSVNSDDPGIFGPSCSLANNLLTVAKRFGLGMEGVRKLTRNAALSAFLTNEEKAELIGKL